MEAVINENVLQAMDAEVRLFPDIETGGVWLGRWEGDVCFITHHIGPGENALRKAYSFSYDAAHVSREAEKLLQDTAEPLKLIGYWHTHHSGNAAFSEGDAELNGLYAQFNGGQAVCGIVTIGDKPELHLYKVVLPLQYEKIMYTVTKNEEVLL
jgi:integrative and conjugative element protein (TIGR02256 family)